MAHYPLYTQNLSLVGVCVKRIGKESTTVLMHGIAEAAEQTHKNGGSHD